MGSKHILIIDDEPYVTTVLSQKLSQAGYDVATGSDGEEGFALASVRPPDLIVSDYQMPVLSGFEMAQRLRAAPATARVPVLLLTARGHRLSPDELATTNIKAVSAKPFSLRALVLKVQELLGESPAPVPAA